MKKLAPRPMMEVSEAYDRLAEEELANLGIVLGAYRSFRGNRRQHIAYVSMPITSGKRLYDVLTEEGVGSTEELVAKCGKDALWERVMQPNISEGIAFADNLGRRENLLFIAPSVFEAKKWRWTQEAYMSLWYRVIGEMAGKMVMMDGWEYSKGGVDEVLFALYLQWHLFRRSNFKEGSRHFNLKNFLPGMSPGEILQELEGMWAMRIFDSKGNEIRLDCALKLCADAIYDLRQKGLPYDTLLEKARKMKAVWAFAPCFYVPDDDRAVLISDSFRETSGRIDALLKKDR